MCDVVNGVCGIFGNEIQDVRPIVPDFKGNTRATEVNTTLSADRMFFI